MERRPSLNGGFLFSDSVIDRDTIQAYLETEYHVQGDAPVTLKIGVAAPKLVGLHNARSVEASAFITACNPFSLTLDPKVNEERQAALVAELKDLRLAFIAGIGQHPSSGWAEPSYLVLGASLEVAMALGVRHEQNAIVWSGPGAVPELVLLR
jgi:hypothetical protein